MILSKREDFIPNGHKIYYWQNGNKRIEGTWSDGKKNGLFSYYNEDGTLNSTVMYRNDAIHGENKKYYSGKPVMIYKYDEGTLISSDDYLGDVLIGKYNYIDAVVYQDPDGIQAPPIGTILHSYKGKTPSETFPGTTWNYIENPYHVDDGGEKDVDFWIRAANSGKGPYVYYGPFVEFRSTDGTKLREGEYTRIKDDSGGYKSVLTSDEFLYRSNGSKMYHAKWSKGTKVEKIEFIDKNNEPWKEVNLNPDTSYKDGFYHIRTEFFNGRIYYDFHPETQAASLRLLK